MIGCFNQGNRNTLPNWDNPLEMLNVSLLGMINPNSLPDVASEIFALSERYNDTRCNDLEVSF